MLLNKLKPLETLVGLKYNQKQVLDSDDLEQIRSIIANRTPDENEKQFVRASHYWGLEKETSLAPIIKKLLDTIHWENTVEHFTAHVVEYKVGHQAYMHSDAATTTIITLVDGEYEGGEMAIDDNLVKLEIGKSVAFTDDTQHGVFPLESGTRIVMVIWTEYNNHAH